jgi:hypothetical protein
MTAFRCCMKEACAEGSVSSATRFNPGRGSFMKGRRPGKCDLNKGVIVIRLSTLPGFTFRRINA